MNLPLKTKIFEYAMNHSPFTIDELIAGIAAGYEKFRYFNVALIEKYIIAYCGVKVITPVEKADNDTNESALKFSITEYGKQSAQYLSSVNSSE